MTFSPSASPTDLAFWQQALGLFPVPLLPGASSGAASDGPDMSHRHVLLNGSRGNFCLDLHGDLPDRHTRNQAWSANVGHFVCVVKDEVRVQRWDAHAGPSVVRFRCADVAQRPDQFHRRLEDVVPRPEETVVSHALLRFRELRAALRTAVSGEEALSGFLCLLASSVDNVRPEGVDRAAWGLNATAVEVAEHVDGATWEALMQALRRGRPESQLATQLPIVLRHAGGMLFQEAHYVAALDPSSQLLMPGIVPSAAKLTKATSGGVGLHFTPAALARTLVEETLAVVGHARPTLTVFDPACGSGEFLREVIRQLSIRRYDGALRVVGFDLSPAACSMARFALAWEQRTAPMTVAVDIRCCDALSEDAAWPTGIDVVLMNPPFVEYRDLTRSQQASIDRILGTHKGARPDLASAFLERASQALNDAGALGTILPASLFDSTSARGLRERLAERMSGRLVARLGSHQLFFQAQVDPGLLVLAKGKSTEAPVACWADHRVSSNAAGLRMLRRMRHERAAAQSTDVALIGIESSVRAPRGDSATDGYSIYTNPRLLDDPTSWSPRPYQAWRLLQELREITPSLPMVKTLFDVRQGVLTGHNKAFLLRADEWARLPANEQRYFRIAVLNESIVDARLATTSYVFYPYTWSGDDAELALATEDELTREVPRYFESHLQPHRDALVARARISMTQWWRLSEYRAWQVEHSSTPKILTTYFGDRGSFAWDSTGDRVIVQGYAWLPKRGAGKLLPAFVPVLNSAVFAQLLTARSNSVGGGQWNLSKRYVADLPLPALASKTGNRAMIRDLAALGERITTQSLAGLSQADRAAVDELADLAYGVSSSS